ncbi:MAG TPA: hypothetical protein VNG71_07695, partial [Pyrinomonadaceae bacterium]|nr:hypothetical protein [Pyrinomonadaceae bacterium]
MIKIFILTAIGYAPGDVAYFYQKADCEAFGIQYVQERSATARGRPFNVYCYPAEVDAKLAKLVRGTPASLKKTAP